MFSNMLNPSNIISFIRNSVDIQKIATNLLNSQEAKEFIENDLGKDYNSFKDNLIGAYMNTKSSSYGLKKEKELEQTKKIEIYRELANSLIKENRIKRLFCYNFICRFYWFR